MRAVYTYTHTTPHLSGSSTAAHAAAAAHRSLTAMLRPLSFCVPFFSSSFPRLFVAVVQCYENARESPRARERAGRDDDAKAAAVYKYTAAAAAAGRQQYDAQNFEL
uniref:Uncharacterized protein n=1 Tax=Trichogramma kaykai TaxID=54128 RepID=A0ABD2W7A8_9HYME